MTHIGHGEKVFNMKRLLLILILTFSFQTPSLADDIRELEIEGISIGDSLLDFFSNDKIKKMINSDTAFFYKNGDWILIGIYKDNQNVITLENYKSLGITINNNDKKYKIYSIAGQNYSFQNINDCNTNQKSISNDIKDVIGNNSVERYYENQKYKINSDGAAIGKTSVTDFDFDDGSGVRIICYELNDEAAKSTNWKVKLEVVLNSKKFNRFLQK